MKEFTMIRKLIPYLILFQGFIFLNITNINAIDNKGNEDSTSQFKRLNINNISTSFGNNGYSDHFRYENFIYPKGSHKIGFWWSGFLWGGKVNDQIRVTGAVHYSSLQQ